MMGILKLHVILNNDLLPHIIKYHYLDVFLNFIIQTVNPELKSWNNE